MVAGSEPGRAAPRRTPTLRPPRVSAALLLLAFALAPLACSRVADPARPDIVLVVVDTLRADHVGVYGHERDTTPNLDALAAEGSHFRQAFAQSSWTLPSMASLLTGERPSAHRVGRHPSDDKRFGRLPDRVTTVAERLEAAGYARGAIVNNTFLAPEFGLDRGFGDDYDYRGATKWAIRSAEESVDAALVWIGGQDRPFFLLLHVMEPHLFYDPPESVRGAFTGNGPAPVEVPFGTQKGLERIATGDLDGPAREYVARLYDEEILAVDRALGRLFDALRARPRWDRTVVVVTADHGEELFDHGGFEHGHTLYSELVRVPLVVRGPRLARGAVDGVVEHIDLARTLVAIGGGDVTGMPSDVDLFTTLREGGSFAARETVSESVLYGPPRASYSDGRRRLQILLDRGRGQVWNVSEDGVEIDRLGPPELDETFRSMSRSLAGIRGGLRAWEPEDGIRLGDGETLSQLKALGYVEER